MPNYTLTYSPPAEGWPSFYSFEPEWIQGMNQFLYTFSGGNIFRHNTNEVRNNFYGLPVDGQGNPAAYPSTIQSVFNDEPIVNKIFKTMAVEGNRPWAATFVSDQQDGRFMDVGFFEKKEGDYFAFVRTVNNNPAEPDDYALRSLNGIGLSLTVVGNVVNFPLTTDIGSILSAGVTGGERSTLRCLWVLNIQPSLSRGMSTVSRSISPTESTALPMTVAVRHPASTTHSGWASKTSRLSRMDCLGTTESLS